MSPRGGGKVRLDQAVVAAGLAPSREKARALVLAGRVLVDGTRVDKPGRDVPADARIELLPGKRPFASRAGEKLAPVLDRLRLDVTGLRCLDVGASTGGFTDVLLRRGAAHVTAVDVGRGLLDQRLREDPRVRSLEGVNARYLRAEEVDPPYDLLVADVSFISLTLVLPAVLPLVGPGGRALVLVKPQFEAGRKEVSRGRGVVRDPAVREAAVRRVADFLADAGWGILAVQASPLPGPRGNREVFLLAAHGPGLPPDERDRAIAAEVGRDRAPDPGDERTR